MNNAQNSNGPTAQILPSERGFLNLLLAISIAFLGLGLACFIAKATAGAAFFGIMGSVGCACVVVLGVAYQAQAQQRADNKAKQA